MISMTDWETSSISSRSLISDQLPIAKIIAAIIYLRNTMNVGLNVSNKFFTIKNVDPKNNAEMNNANKDLFFSLMNI